MRITLDAIKNKSKIRSFLKVLTYILAAIIIGGWIRFTPEGLLGKMDAIGYAVCHRIDLRSFHLGDRAVPLCARCSGQYLGAMLGLLVQNIVSKKRAGFPPTGMIIVLGIFAIVFAVDGLNSYLHLIPEFSRFYLYEPSNINRIVTGTGLGIALSMLVFPAFRQSMLEKPEKKAAIGNWWVFILLIGVGLVMDIFVLTENPLILYPAALISAAGVIVLLTMVYAMVWVMMFRKENQYEKFSDMIFPMVIGLTAAITQIAIFDFIRYFLTGTWNGFHFG